MLYIDGKINCWLDDFVEFLDKHGQAYPIDSPQNQTEEFYFWLNKFIDDPKGLYHKENLNIGMVDGKLVYTRVNAKAAGGIYDPYFKKFPNYQRWEDLLAAHNSSAPSGVNGAR